MDKLIETLGGSLHSLPPTLIFFFLVWISLLVVWVRRGTTGSFRKTLRKLTTSRDIQHAEAIHQLKDHDIFNVIAQVRGEIKYINFYTDDKKDLIKHKMFVDFVNHKLDSIQKGVLHIIEDAETAETIDGLKYILLDTISEIVKEYCRNTLDDYIANDISYSNASYIVDLFEKWRRLTVQSLGARINGIFSSQFHYTRFDKLLACLEVMSMAIELITKDGVGAFDEMNGVFQQIVEYKGISKKNAT